jgi:hypothetical protein
VIVGPLHYLVLTIATLTFQLTSAVVMIFGLLYFFMPALVWLLGLQACMISPRMFGAFCACLALTISALGVGTTIPSWTPPVEALVLGLVLLLCAHCFLLRTALRADKTP